VTAEVYRCEARALKVITETRDIAPHNPAREAKILAQLTRPCVPLLETFRDQEQRFVLVFPYMPLSLEALLTRGALRPEQIKRHFTDLFTALQQIHGQGILHRDVKPSALLLASPDGPAVLSDFGTAWHPELSLVSEPADQKVLDIGTGPYRAPDVLFGDRAYGPSVDMWSAGTMLAECCRNPPLPLFESRAVHEDGNQLGLILSIFRTMGSPTRETWPEAARFRTPPFEMYRTFAPRPWEDILPDVPPDFRVLVAMLVKYDSTRASATEVRCRPHVTDVAKQTTGPASPRQRADRPPIRLSRVNPSRTNPVRIRHSSVARSQRRTCIVMDGSTRRRLNPRRFRHCLQMITRLRLFFFGCRKVPRPNSSVSFLARQQIAAPPRNEKKSCTHADKPGHSATRNSEPLVSFGACMQA
jgi:cyclin-dependent kinase